MYNDEKPKIPKVQDGLATILNFIESLPFLNHLTYINQNGWKY